jgi:hypothetical protein
VRELLRVRTGVGAWLHVSVGRWSMWQPFQCRHRDRIRTEGIPDLNNLLSML